MKLFFDNLWHDSYLDGANAINILGMRLGKYEVSFCIFNFVFGVRIGVR